MTRLPPSLSVTFTNIRSVSSKADELGAFIEDTKSDIVVLTETWLRPDIASCEAFAGAENFNIYRKDRQHRRGGGVLIAVTKDISTRVINVDSNLEIVWVSLSSYFVNTLLGVCYRPPDADPGFADDLRSVLAQINASVPHTNIMLFGDFNFPNICWSTLTSPSPESSGFLDVCLDFNLEQVITEPTRLDNILDLVLASNPEIIKSISVVDGFSDHRLLLINLELACPRQTFRSKIIRDYNKADYASINRELQCFYDSYVELFWERTLDINWTLFKDKLTDLIEQYVPRVLIRSTNKPWFNKTLNNIKNRKKRFFKKAKKCNTDTTWLRYSSTAKEYNTLLKQAKHKFYTLDLPSLLFSNPRKFWKIIYPKESEVTPSLHTETGDPVPVNECPTLLNNYFTSVFTVEDLTSVPFVPDCNYAFMESISIDPDGIAKLIESLKVSTSAGIDNINSKILKNTKEISKEILCLLFNQSLSTGAIPREWKVGKVIPIYKNGDRHSACNYRPISLTSVVCKLLEHIIFSHTISHLESNNFFYKHQYGFRRGYSCEQQLLEFSHDIHTNMEAGAQTDAIFLDFSKAFDRVPHARLIAKLSSLNLDSLTISWIRNFLSLRYQFTVCGNSKSKLSDVTSGVPQGSVLGPLLFFIYINDLPSNISSSLRLFADDCVLYRKIVTPHDSLILHQDLQAVNNWCLKWLMTLNTAKCKVMSFTRKHNLWDHPYTLGTEGISRASSYRYLGVHLTSNLSSALDIIQSLLPHLVHLVTSNAISNRLLPICEN